MGACDTPPGSVGHALGQHLSTAGGPGGSCERMILMKYVRKLLIRQVLYHLLAQSRQISSLGHPSIIIPHKVININNIISQNY